MKQELGEESKEEQKEESKTIDQDALVKAVQGVEALRAEGVKPLNP